MLTLFDAGSYIIHLYDKIGGIFVCSQIKLEKILILAQIRYKLMKKADLINDIDIIFAEDCGFSLDTRETYFRTPITTAKESKDEKLDDSLQKLIKEPKQSIIFNFSEENISKEARDFLNTIFIEFASYNPRTLGSILDKIKNCEHFKEMKQNSSEPNFEIPLSDFYIMVDSSDFKV